MYLHFSIFTLSLFLLIVNGDDDSLPSSPFWSGWGGNYHNNRFASSNTAIKSSSISSLTHHCLLAYPSGISATPTVYGNNAYFPTWSGSVVALDYTTCLPLWTTNITSIIALTGPITPPQINLAISRTSPQVDGGVLYIGTLAHALIIALNLHTGTLLSTISINSHPLALITMSPTFHSNKLFVGASSAEESAADNPGYACCSFVGNVVALSFSKSASTFTILWDIPMIPPSLVATGWSGVGVWGSQPSIDVSRNQVFFATGNTYSIPLLVAQCQNSTSNLPAVAEGLIPDPCLPRDVMQETVIAVDIDLGILNWVHQLPALDAWTLACGVPNAIPEIYSQCPHIPGPDADFGMAPTFIPGSSSTPYGKDTLVIGQKNGILHAMSAETGQSFWSTMTSPGGTGGGLSWGIAVDDSRVYFTAINSMSLSWQLQPSNVITNTSGYGAASLSTGKILWEIATPSGSGTVAYGPPTIAGDLILVADTGYSAYYPTNGSLVAIEKTTGKVVSNTDVLSAFHGGVAVQGSHVLFGTGYGGLASLSATTGYFYVMRIRT